MSISERNALKAALQWHIESGADEALADEPIDRTQIAPPVASPLSTTVPDTIADTMPAMQSQALDETQNNSLLGSSDAHAKAITLAKKATTIDELQDAIRSFNGLAIKKTATNIVFADGNPKARIMLIGDAPGTDEDRQGKPFTEESGQLLDKILGCIDLDRNSDDLARAVYLSNILNWRPPGNRTPTAAETEVSLPFIERHIALVQPQFLILCGGISAKALLGETDSISRLRGKLHSYSPRTDGINEKSEPIPSIVTYHPSFLLHTPSQKRAVWEDMLMLKKSLQET